MSAKLGQLLLKAGLIDEQRLERALCMQKEIGGKLGTVLVKLRFVPEDKLTQFLGTQFNMPVMKLKDLVVSQRVSPLLDVEVLEKHQVLPIRLDGDTLLLAVSDPLDLPALDEIRFLTRMRVECAVASRSDIQKAIDYYFNGRSCEELKQAEKAVLEAERSATNRKSIEVPPAEKAPGPANEKNLAAKKKTDADPVRMIKELSALLVEKRVVSAKELSRHGIPLP